MMIFDEPFNGIEEKTVEVIKKILLEEKKSGKIILIASHIKEDIEELADADTIYFVDNGSVNNYKKK